MPPLLLRLAAGDEPTPLESGLLAACGGLWTATYALLILQAHRSRVPAMPYFALCLNITWELLFSLLHPHPWPQRGIDIAWLSLDCVLLAQTLSLYPYRSPPLSMSFTSFALATAVTLSTLLAVHWSWAVQLDAYGAYSAFVIDLFMAVAFVVMLLTRSPRGAGQSVAIGVSKWVGTLCSSAAFYLLSDGDNALLNTLFVACFAWDGLYVLLLLHTRVVQRKGGVASAEDDAQQSLPWLMTEDSSAHAGLHSTHAALL